MDIREARAWYDGQRLGLGDEFLLVITDAMIQLEETPQQFPLYYRGFRRLLTERFPYKVFFVIEGDTVIVFHVIHAARDHTRLLK
jgi:toxin ParE1/3/4